MTTRDPLHDEKQTIVPGALGTVKEIKAALRAAWKQRDEAEAEAQDAAELAKARRKAWIKSVEKCRTLERDLMQLSGGDF